MEPVQIKVELTPETLKLIDTQLKDKTSALQSEIKNLLEDSVSQRYSNISDLSMEEVEKSIILR